MPVETLEAISTMTLVALLISLAGQVQHGYLRAMHSNPRVRTVVVVYECALLIHILLMTAHNVHSAHAGIGTAAESGFDALGPLDTLLWLNFAVGATTAYATLVDMSDSGEPEVARWLPPLETILVFCCTPPALALFGEARFVPFAVDAVYFFIRTVTFIALDARNSRKIVSPLSIADALRRLPEGILYADENGRVIIANDAMSHCLSSLDIAGPSSNVADIWNLLNEKASRELGIHVPQEYMRKPGLWVILHIGEDEARLFSFENVDLSTQDLAFDGPSPEAPQAPAVAALKTFGNKPATRIIAYDVTEEIRILEETEQTNASLAALQQDLEASIENVREAAENEALLRMRARVHDVIGQRVSMLHRSLEDNEMSREKIEQLKPLLSSILEDLSADIQISPEDEIDATIAAFAMTDLEIHTEGGLPENPRHAKIFADAIREAATNAVRHGDAKRVDAVIGESFIEISNDGIPADAMTVEGVGLSSIRHAVETEGGALSVTNAPFTVRIEFPQT